MSRSSVIGRGDAEFVSQKRSCFEERRCVSHWMGSFLLVGNCWDSGRSQGDIPVVPGFGLFYLFKQKQDVGTTGVGL